MVGLAVRVGLTSGLLGAVFAVAAPGAVSSGDWPAYRHDERRSAVAGSALRPPLTLLWRHAGGRPRPAWTGPAKWDAFSGNRSLQPMRNFDPVFFVTAVGDQVFFGSSRDHGVHCLAAATGEERWVYFTGGPVRLPPTWAAGRLYAASDDGVIYCLDAATGELVWRFSPGRPQRLIPSNGNLISLAPCRTGVSVSGDIAYAAASLLPWEPSFLVALDTATGRADGPECYVRELRDVTLQGAMLVSDDALFVPQGRSAPLAFRRSDGEPLGPVKGGGGTFLALTDDGRLLSGPGNQKAAEDVVRLGDARRRQSQLALPGARQMLVSEGTAFLYWRQHLTALDLARLADVLQRQADLNKQRQAAAKQKDRARVAQLDAELELLKAALHACYRWQVSQPAPEALLLAGELLVTGSSDAVSAVDAGSGELRWETRVSGIAFGLAAAGGRLLVSTDAGDILCFGPGRSE